MFDQEEYFQGFQDRVRKACFKVCDPLWNNGKSNFNLAGFMNLTFVRFLDLRQDICPFKRAVSFTFSGPLPMQEIYLHKCVEPVVALPLLFSEGSVHVVSTSLMVQANLSVFNLAKYQTLPKITILFLYTKALKTPSEC